MTASDSRRRVHRAVAAGVAVLLAGGVARAQTITGVVAAKNAGNSANEISTANPSYERESAVQVIAATATAFTSRYSGLASADSGLFGDPRWETLNSDYTLTFTVNAPGAYRLIVAGRRKGDLHLVEDNILASGHYADMTALTGAFTGGTLSGGTLNLADPGRADDIPLVFDPISVPFDQTSTATITAVSNGAPVAHTLTFTWSQQAYSPGSGDEAAIRLGGTSDDNTETAADYPGSPARAQVDDGHFVTVTLVSLCGNGVVDSGPGFSEACDAGAGNGQPGSCCSLNCTPASGGMPCRAAGLQCDVTEYCDGVSGACPADGFAAPTVVCRAASAGQLCDLDELCDGSSPFCPPDQVKSAGSPCRAATGACDVAESCDGVATTCPTDAHAADGTSCGDGAFCNGGETCHSGSCGAGSPPCVGACDEGTDSCTGLCPPAPQGTCGGAARGALLIKNSSDSARDTLTWKWLKGAATTQAQFGDPTAAADYSLCLYAGGVLVGELQVPASSSKWAPLGSKGWRYFDPSGAPGGAQKISLKGGADGKSKALLKGRGIDLPDPIDDLPLALPVTVQLVNGDNGRCWQSVFATASRNTTSQFKAK
ncbi:MAG: hypothetical protein SF182_30565 [Deltaproteobacteria bacterium]|nr:hypothetical protein [Deltaproteobacteria bacterium]